MLTLCGEQVECLWDEVLPIDAREQRAIVLQVLCDDHPQRWTRAELERELSDLPREGVETAIEDLAADGVVTVAGDEAVRVSLCVRTIDINRPGQSPVKIHLP